MSLSNVQSRRWIRILGLAVLTLPALLGSLPGLHSHDLSELEPTRVTAPDAAGNEAECALCALSRHPGQTDPPEPLECNRPEMAAGQFAPDPVQPSRSVPADSDPRAPPVCDSIWNV